ncbi:DUF4126 family protein [Pontibacter sp. 172403-2]|uniref:DUF4126 family protein n=1 Tax=Pontibacter rufus TaxID=2791028 RepID=UPI0018AFC714|nr:DUF4126 family protein [Pontibacter sp. 172403-2]MBF9254543.1 DUF4126 family protein [Pontibacter sp. 172403-2]
MNNNNPIWRTLGLGAIAGMRSMTAPALLSNELSNAPTAALAGSPLRYLQHGPVATGLKLLAASELVGDKIPGMPDRISPPILLPRALSGALVGATIFTVHQDSWIKGAAIGAAAAVAATYGSFYLRKLMNKYAPNAVSGALEDALTLGSGLAIAKR